LTYRFPHPKKGTKWSITLWQRHKSAALVASILGSVLPLPLKCAELRPFFSLRTHLWWHLGQGKENTAAQSAHERSEGNKEKEMKKKTLSKGFFLLPREQVVFLASPTLVSLKISAKTSPSPALRSRLPMQSWWENVAFLYGRTTHLLFSSFLLYLTTFSPLTVATFFCMLILCERPRPLFMLCLSFLSFSFALLLQSFLVCSSRRVQHG